MQLTEHFALAEMTASQQAGLASIHNQPNPTQLMRLRTLCAVLEQIRDRVGGPIVIHSGFRTYLLNTLVGGARTSSHMQGWAADFHRPNIRHEKLWNEIKAMGEEGIIKYDQLILYDRHVHLSVDPRFRMKAW